MNELELHPGKILILPDEAETVSSGGLHIPETATSREKPMFGVVVAFGAGEITSEGRQIAASTMFPSLKEGCRVMFSGFAAQPLEMDGVRHLLLRYDDLYGIVREDPVAAGASGNGARRRKKK